jgi:cell division protein FtsB
LLKRPAKIAAKNIETPMAAISDNTKITRLMSDIEHLTQERDQSKAENRKIKENLEGTKTGLAAAIVFGVLGILIAIGIGQDEYNSMESSYSPAIYDKNQLYDDALSKDYDALQTTYDALSKDNDALQTKYDTLSKNNDALQTTYDTLSNDNDALQTNYDALSDYVASSNLLPIKITAIEVGNWNNGWVNRPGGTLTHTSVYRLVPEISYQALANANIKLDIKWFFPNNDLPSRWEESAPTGYTYTENITVLAQGGTSTLPRAWSVHGGFPSGTHKIEIWWNGIMLSSTTVTLN